MKKIDNRLPQYEPSTSNQQDYISVCICTFKRPRFLAKLLNKLQEQVTEDAFTYSIVVVDNDILRSGKDVVDLCKKTSKVNISYYHVPEQNISLARNKSVKKANGNFIAFIDDDEFPEEFWLLNLYKAIYRFNADGILGPVKPHFEFPPQNWIIKGKLCDRKSFKTGTVIKSSKDTRTGNVLLPIKILKENETPFDPSFGRIGGGDADFFKRKMGKGYKFVWCNEACVYETVPVERQKRSYFLKRAFTRGVANAINMPFISTSTLKSIIAVVLYSLALPFFLLFAHHLFMKYLIKNCDHLSKLLSYCNIRVVKERPY